MRSAQLVLGAGLVATGQAQMWDDRVYEGLRYYDGFHGAWLGFNRGLYKLANEYPIGEECLNSKTRDSWIEAHSIFLGVDPEEDNDFFTAKPSKSDLF